MFLASCSSVFIRPKESCLRHGISCPLEMPLCLSINSTWSVNDQTEMTKQGAVGKRKSTLDSSGLASTKSPQELRGGLWVPARWGEQKGGLGKPVPGSKVGRIDSIDLCRAEFDRPNSMWENSRDTPQWFYTTEGQTSKTNHQQPPGERRVPWSVTGHTEVAFPWTARVITILKKAVEERQYLPATSMRRRLISTSVYVHSPHRHVSSPFACPFARMPVSGVSGVTYLCRQKSCCHPLHSWNISCRT